MQYIEHTQKSEPGIADIHADAFLPELTPLVTPHLTQHAGKPRHARRHTRSLPRAGKERKELRDGREKERAPFLTEGTAMARHLP